MSPEGPFVNSRDKTQISLWFGADCEGGFKLLVECLRLERDLCGTWKRRLDDIHPLVDLWRGKKYSTSTRRRTAGLESTFLRGNAVKARVRNERSALAAYLDFQESPPFF
jgi:hypothetical protein